MIKSKILGTKYKLSPQKREWFRNYKRKYRIDGRDKVKRKYNRDYFRNYQRKAREYVLKEYGGKCLCCGESELVFLAIDHIDGGGNKHRNCGEIKITNIAMWLIKNNFPKGFRVLCHNCNMAMGLYGRCPHDDKIYKQLTK